MSFRYRGEADRRRRVGDDHVHPDLWTEADQIRFQDRLHAEMAGIRDELKVLSRVAGGLSLAAIAGPTLVVLVLRFLLPP